MARRILFLLLISTCLLAADSSKRIEPQVAEQNLTKKVDPAVPPLAKAAQIGGAVLLEITISPEGKVGTVKVLSGHPMLAPAFVEAVRKWEYRPFVQDGQPVSVVATVEWNVPSPTRTNAEQKALKDYDPTFQACYQMFREGKDTDAEKKCSDAVTLSDGLPADRLIERSSSRTFLAHALMAESKPEEAIPLYQKAVEIRKGVEHSERDADFASENANLARAYFITSQLDKADALYHQVVTIFQAAIVALPEMHDNYTSRLKSTLLEYAKLKSSRGDVDAANALEQKAAGLQAH
jgi:TonB family protein